MLQYDPLNPCGRNIDLLLQARIADYRVNNYYRWAYDERHGVEGYDKVLCVLPVEDWSYLRFGAQSLYHLRSAFAREYRVELDQLVARIRADGPIAAASIDDGRRVDIGWYNENPWSKVALETLWRLGELVVVRGRDGRKVYDVPERVYGRLPTTQPTVGEHILRRVGSVGLLPLTGKGAGWLGIGLGRRLRSEIQALVQGGELLEVVVEGVKTRYVLRAADAGLLDENEEAALQMTFLAPLDNALWDRDMVHELFGFFYRWEVYVPPSKRQYGYYVLPVLYGDQLIGRIEPVLSKDRTLDIKGFWLEPEVEWSREVDEALDRCLERFCAYASATSVRFSAIRPSQS